jgi:hypothetical protein
MEKRNLIILISTILIGFIIVLSIFLLDNKDDIFGTVTVHNNVASNYQSIIDDIDSIGKNKFDPSIYTTLNSQIASSYSCGLFSIVIKNDLENKLKEAYSKSIFKECDNYLYGYSSDYYYVIKLLKNLDAIFDDPKINFYYTQISNFNNFTKVLPGQISNFINSGVSNYTQFRYDLLKNSVLNFSGLDSRFQSSGFLNNLKSKYLNDLGRFNYQWITSK